ncbi:hypothetical protein [Paraburkholderia sediminicola]|jgi:hypothetical protein|uniref:hypothetical protein n=1 Tax=Paraburkholderia sediminicola TaxID=458836 RepID=UPI0038B8FBB5
MPKKKYVANVVIDSISPHTHSRFERRYIIEMANGTKKQTSVTSSPIFHGHPDTARSSAYAAYDTPAPSKGNNKFAGAAFFVISQIGSFRSTGNIVGGFDFGIEGLIPVEALARHVLHPIGIVVFEYSLFQVFGRRMFGRLAAIEA